jgi:hypothetical protein
MREAAAALQHEVLDLARIRQRAEQPEVAVQPPHRSHVGRIFEEVFAIAEQCEVAVQFLGAQPRHGGRR